jgi:hypothetical protein
MPYADEMLEEMAQYSVGEHISTDEEDIDDPF